MRRETRLEEIVFLFSFDGLPSRRTSSLDFFGVFYIYGRKRTCCVKRLPLVQSKLRRGEEGTGERTVRRAFALVGATLQRR